MNNLVPFVLLSITIIPKRDLSAQDRNFAAELVSEEARKTIKSYSFILHDIIESKKYLKILIEGTKAALINLLSVIENNFSYDKITYARHY